MPKQKNRSIYTLLYWVISEAKRGRETEIERERDSFILVTLLRHAAARCVILSPSRF